MTAAVQRFTRGARCPVCGGCTDDPRGAGKRCFGFGSSDGTYAHCTRLEHAGGLPLNSNSNTYAHRLVGDCKCGRRHDARPPSVNGQKPQGRRIVATYDYCDTGGRLLFQVVRWEPKAFGHRRPDGRGGWVWNLQGVTPVLYRLPTLGDPTRRGELVHISEGEKDADNLAALGLVATTAPMGAGKWRPEYAGPLHDRDVVVLPDNDEPGRNHAEQVCASLIDVAASVKLLQLPNLPPKGDVSDWLDAGGTPEELERLAAGAPAWSPEATAADDDQPRASEQETKPNKRSKQSQRLVALAVDAGAEVFHSPDGEAFATFPAGGHRETWPLKSKVFRRWLIRLCFEETQAIPSAQAMQEAFGLLEARAHFDGAECQVFTRIAEHGGSVYLDLADASWQVVEITESGWRVVDDPPVPVRFRRGRGMLPLPPPVQGGKLAGLRELVNISDEDDWRLLLAWLVGALRPRGPYAVLVLHGEQGSAKSTLARLLRALVDPSTVPLRAEPREVRDLMIAASGNWVISYDNLSHLPDWLSDAICRLATGGGFGTRELYSDSDEVLFEAMRPVVLNGIEELATRGDLLDRAIVVYLPALPEAKRRPEVELSHDFEAMRPGLLGALLDAVSAALRNLPRTRLAKLPRMADFATWVVAAEPALPWPAGGFLDAYAENRAAATSLTVEASPVGEPVRGFVAAIGKWSGTATELLRKLQDQADDETRRQRERAKAWPKNGRTLANALRRLAPALRAGGIDIEFDRAAHSGRRLIHLQKVAISSSPSSPSSPATEERCVDAKNAMRPGDDSGVDGDDAGDERRALASPEVLASGRQEQAGGDDGDARTQPLSKGDDDWGEV